VERIDLEFEEVKKRKKSTTEFKRGVLRLFGARRRRRDGWEGYGGQAARLRKRKQGSQ